MARVEAAVDAQNGRVLSRHVVRAAERESERLLADARRRDTRDAIAAWDLAIEWTDRSRAIGADVPDATTLQLERRRAEDQLAQRYYELGREAQSGGRWEAALEAYDTARAIRPDYSDTSIRLARVFVALGEADLAAGRYHAALDAFQWSDAASPSIEIRGRAATLRLALARSDLERGFCRTAHDALVVSPAATASEIETSRRCARIELVLSPAVASPFRSIPADRVGAAFDAALIAALRSRASAHVRLRTPEAVTVLSNGRLGEGGGEGPLDAANGIRYEVTVSMEGSARLEARFRVAEERSGAVAAEATVPLALAPSDVIDETDASPPDASLLSEVARRWAAEAADTILGTIDRPIESPDPASLALPPPVPADARPDGTATGEPI